jgi:siroheme synthase (precorrin-2 oxidase/ferrochelatase)
MSSNTQKLRVLRARTDHDLLTLICRELDRGMLLVSVAANRNSPLFAEAQRACEAAAALLPRVSTVSEDLRARIEARLKELRWRLDAAPAFAEARNFPASVAS